MPTGLQRGRPARGRLDRQVMARSALLGGVGGTLYVGDRAVRLELWQGEVISYAAERG
jgi:hypothetical protein